MQPSSELSGIIAAWFESVMKGDPSWVDHHLSRKAETRLVGTDPNEVLAGEQVAEFLKGEVRAMGASSRPLWERWRRIRKVPWAGGWLALRLPCPTAIKSFLGGAPSFTRKMVSGSWCNSTPPSVYLTRNC
jgi:hypothetical protein